MSLFIEKQASELFDIWKHTGRDECAEQIEAHLESNGFSNQDIAAVLQSMENSFAAEFGL